MPAVLEPPPSPPRNRPLGWLPILALVLALLALVAATAKVSRMVRGQADAEDHAIVRGVLRSYRPRMQDLKLWPCKEITTHDYRVDECSPYHEYPNQAAVLGENRGLRRVRLVRATYYVHQDFAPKEFHDELFFLGLDSEVLAWCPTGSFYFAH